MMAEAVHWGMQAIILMVSWGWGTDFSAEVMVLEGPWLHGSRRQGDSTVGRRI